MEKNIKKLPAPLPKRVMRLEEWYKNRPKGWLVVQKEAEIVDQVIVEDSLGNELDRIEFPEGYGVVFLPWVFDADDDYMFVGHREDLAKILEAYNLLYDARLNFLEVLENLEE